MKKQFLFFVSVCALVFSTMTFGQGSDNFDTYIAGQMLACQNPAPAGGTGWSTWTNSPCLAGEDAVVSNTFALSAPNSAKIVSANDLVYLFGEKNSGTWYTSFNFYIPATKSGYWNMLSAFTFSTGGYWAFEMYFDAGGAGRLIANHVTTNFSWTAGQWNFIELKVNLGTDAAEMKLNNNLILAWPWTQGSSAGAGTLVIDAADFYGAATTDEMYFDNFWFNTTPVPVELTSFTASTGNGNVTLNWSTASEVNNRGFEVQRRTVDGQYSTIGFVEGYGTTTETKNYTFVDNSIQSVTYFYRLRQVDFNGNFEYSDEVEVNAVGVTSYSLGQNYPNPFNPSTVISYTIPEAGYVKLAVYNTLGQEVATLVNGQKDAGNYNVTFDAKQLPSGSYFYSLEAGNTVLAKKMLLTK